MSTSTNPPPPLVLSFEAVDELIYDARSGDLDALKTEIEKWSKEHNSTPSAIIRSALDTESEPEGGTGACLLHWPAANGNVDLLKFLLQTLTSSSSSSESSSSSLASFINYRNYTGNTPLHWAALNTHLDCIKVLVEAGADIDAKNNAGHDALFLAERADWASAPDPYADENEAAAEAETQVGRREGEGEKPAAPPTKARLVVEWLLGCEKGVRFEQTAADGSEEGPDGGMEEAEEMKTS